MKRVLIVSEHFPPLNSMASKRYGFMSKYMEENGYLPYILTKMPRAGAYINLKKDLQCPLPKERVIRIGELGITYPVTVPILNELISVYHRHHIFSRVVTEQDIGWFSKVCAEIDLERLKDIDVVIGTFPGAGNLLVANYIADQLDVPYIAEIRDLISDYQGEFQRDEEWNKRELEFEKVILDGASGIVTVTEGFSSIISDRYPDKRIQTVYNGWDDSVSNHLVDADSSKMTNYLYYAGSLYEHRLESIKLLLEVLKENNMSLKAIIRSVGPQELDVKLKNFIEKEHFSMWGDVLPAAMESVVKNEQAGAKINLIVGSIDSSDTALMNTIPGKAFELIRLKQPVLAIADKNSEISKILDQTHKGIASSNKKEIADFLCEDHIKYVGINKEADFFSRKNQAIILCEFLDEVLDGDNIIKKPIFDGLSTLGGTITSRVISGTALNNMIVEKQKEKEKYRIMYQLMEKWMKLKQDGKSLELYFKSYNYKKIAIYGMGDIGKLLLKELRDTSVAVVYGIDKNKDTLADIDIISPNNELQQVDAIVVTAIAYFGEIDEMLSEKINCPIISLEDIVYELV